MSIVSLVIAPYIAVVDGGETCCKKQEILKCNINGKEYTCTSKAQCDSIMSLGKKDIVEVKGAYNVDGAHSSVAFSIKHIISDTRGTINVDSGVVNLDAASGNKIYIRMDMASLNTQNSMRDGHLKDKPEFFDVAKYKKAIFEATYVIKDTTMGEFSYIAKGKLTLKGVTKDVTLNFNYVGLTEGKTYTEKGETPANIIGFNGKTTIKRTDFNVGESGGLGEDVNIEITLEAAQPK